MRLFVGLELPTQVCDELAGLCHGLKEVRWVEPQNLHLTLAFLGEVDPVQFEDLHEGLSKIEFDPFTLHLGQVDCFESRGRAHVLWAGVDGDRVALCHLQHKVMSMLERAGLEPERRKFKPHVTLSWLKKVPKEKLMDYFTTHNSFQSAPFEVDRFALYRSHLTPHGAQYEVLERYRLSHKT